MRTGAVVHPFSLFFLTFLFFVGSACSGGTSPLGTDDTADSVPGGVEIPGTTVKGTIARDLKPKTSDLSALSAENADFSLDLLRELHLVAPGDLVASPYSLQTVMAQVYAGADGASKTAIATAFGWTIAEPAFHEAFDALDLIVSAHHDAAADPPVEVVSTNQVFVTTGYDLGAPWLDVLSEFYGTGVQVMDFEADPAAVAEAIDAWISARTSGRIDDLVSEKNVASSRMLLVNALYFKASWEVPFTESSTSDLPFTLLDGSEVDVPTMSGLVAVRGASADGFLVADLPYSDDELCMTLVVPDVGRFDDVVSGLEWATLRSAIDEEVSCPECQVTMPKFQVEGKAPVQEALTALGMKAAFGGYYPGINEALTLSAVNQAGFVAVSEKGTEAAAATEVDFSDSGTVPTLDPIVVDRPFLWFVREVETGAVLYDGIVVDPR
jgi:serpin B